ncbi:MAG: nitrogen regulation protein NR(I), partial [Burkholderiaceae bacterium]|nr:nitrogen regulation protein NR(I) [Burkholderiaceae bacterium]
VEQMPLPGNVRQLENLCHWLTVLAPAQVVKVEDLPLELREPSPAPAAVAVPPAASAAALPEPAAASGGDWAGLLEREVELRLRGGERDLMESITRRFEATVIGTALRLTHGRRIEAATRLGLGRNTITRKIQELRLEED